MGAVGELLIACIIAVSSVIAGTENLVETVLERDPSVEAGLTVEIEAHGLLTQAGLCLMRGIDGYDTPRVREVERLVLVHRQAILGIETAHHGNGR